MINKVLGICALTIFLAAASSSAHAAVVHDASCGVANVTWQRPISNPNVPNDLLLITCVDTTVVTVYVGTPGTGCYVSADAAKAFESLAVSAGLSGKLLDIWYNSAQNCPGNSNQSIISSVTLKF